MKCFLQATDTCPTCKGKGVVPKGKFTKALESPHPSPPNLHRTLAPLVLPSRTDLTSSILVQEKKEKNKKPHQPPKQDGPIKGPKLPPRPKTPVATAPRNQAERQKEELDESNPFFDAKEELSSQKPKPRFPRSKSTYSLDSKKRPSRPPPLVPSDSPVEFEFSPQFQFADEDAFPRNTSFSALRAKENQEKKNTLETLKNLPSSEPTKAVPKSEILSISHKSTDRLPNQRVSVPSFVSRENQKPVVQADIWREQARAHLASIAVVSSPKAKESQTPLKPIYKPIQTPKDLTEELDLRLRLAEIEYNKRKNERQNKKDQEKRQKQHIKLPENKNFSLKRSKTSENLRETQDYWEIYFDQAKSPISSQALRLGEKNT